MPKILLTAMTLLALSAAPLFAQEGPSVPCVDCDTLTQAPFPETGSWFNPEQSGSGLVFEIQNGVLAGSYYGYDANGLPEWYLINGPLVRSEQAGLQWEIETQLKYFQGGNCIGCDYKPPTYTEGSTIKLEFQQRNHMRLTIGDNPGQFFVPIMYGTSGIAYFSEQTPYLFPKFESSVTEYAMFVLIMKPNTDPVMPENWDSLLVPVGTGKQNALGKLTYKTWFPQTGPPGPDVFIDFIVCDLEAMSEQPVCTIHVGQKEYLMPIANFGDARFFGEAEDGSTIEGYRLTYD